MDTPEPSDAVEAAAISPGSSAPWPSMMPRTPQRRAGGALRAQSFGFTLPNDSKPQGLNPFKPQNPCTIIFETLNPRPWLMVEGCGMEVCLPKEPATRLPRRDDLES